METTTDIIPGGCDRPGEPITRVLAAFPGAEVVNGTHCHPYADTASRYLAAGWNPMPMDPTRNKSTPPVGFTGYRGRGVTAADVGSWSKSKADHHVGLRLPPDVIGVDVDHYGDKVGADHIAKLEGELGELPPTWMSTSRPDTPAGIHFYRVPVGARFPTRPCLDVEFIQNHHRLAVVWPSVHREGRRYRWYEPSGELSDEIPNVEDLTELPWSWYERFVRRDRAGDPATEATAEEVAAFVDAHTGSGFPAALDGVKAKLEASSGSRHDRLVEFGCWAMIEAAAGRFPAADAHDVLERWWAKVMAGDDRLTDVTPHGLTEFGHAIAWCVAQATSEEGKQRVAEIRSRDNLGLRRSAGRSRSSDDAPQRPLAGVQVVQQARRAVAQPVQRHRPVQRLQVLHGGPVAGLPAVLSRPGPLLVVVAPTLAHHAPPSVVTPPTTVNGLSACSNSRPVNEVSYHDHHRGPHPHRPTRRPAPSGEVRRRAGRRDPQGLRHRGPAPLPRRAQARHAVAEGTTLVPLGALTASDWLGFVGTLIAAFIGASVAIRVMLTTLKRSESQHEMSLKEDRQARREERDHQRAMLEEQRRLEAQQAVEDAVAEVRTVRGVLEATNGHPILPFSAVTTALPLLTRRGLGDVSARYQSLVLQWNGAASAT